MKKLWRRSQRDPARLYPHDLVLRRTLLPLFPAWVRPNHLTILRFLLAPFVLWFLMEERYAVGVPLFFVTALTDALDGSLARVRGQITPWGTFYDPVADKLLIGSVVLLTVTKHLGWGFALLIISMELLIVLGGVFNRRRGRPLSANAFGKTKMFLEVMGVLALLLSVWFGIDALEWVSIGTLCLALGFAVLSLLSYGI